jgi:hypothetical protein
MRVRILAGVVASVIACGCSSSTEPPRALNVSVAASAPSAQAGDTLSFVVEATGSNLVGVTIDYGDDESAQYATGGATSAHVTFKHAFSSAGEFVVQAVVTDALSGEKGASVAVVITAPTPAAGTT